ncbi:hypothetical protein IW492_08925 [Enterococcus sp. BWB1-3]|uniref:hypothetical protein n=1 Tax=Enterococcus sp. BWB1-3 TaxID=2787713 RepID=UPI00192227ED|nr:hypothetical protein [Enterococcus sp. BWB1-3]MBL1229351.1 hypothetical protein [Enterococcus sp. BWB1-3]
MKYITLFILIISGLIVTSCYSPNNTSEVFNKQNIEPSFDSSNNSEPTLKQFIGTWKGINTDKDYSLVIQTSESRLFNITLSEGESKRDFFEYKILEIKDSSLNLVNEQEDHFINLLLDNNELTFLNGIYAESTEGTGRPIQFKKLDI